MQKCSVCGFLTTRNPPAGHSHTTAVLALVKVGQMNDGGGWGVCLLNLRRLWLCDVQISLLSVVRNSFCCCSGDRGAPEVSLHGEILYLAPVSVSQIESEGRRASVPGVRERSKDTCVGVT